MAIAHDAQTRFPVTNGLSGTNSVDTTTGDRTFTHTPTGTPKGVILVLQGNVTTSLVTGVLYGGVAMTLQGIATDTSEAGQVQIWTLSERAIPAGPQIVTLQGCTASPKWCTVSTVTAATIYTTVHNFGLINTTTAANPTVTLINGKPTLIYGGVHTGAAAPATAVGAGCTLQHSNDYGALAANSLRRTSEDAAGSVALTATLASDDHCIAGVAFSELDPTGLWCIHRKTVWNTTTTPKTVTFEDCLNGDEFFVSILGDQSSGNTITSVTVSTTAGNTTAWAKPIEDLGGGLSTDWYVLGRARCNADSATLTIQVDRVKIGATGGNWGFYVIRARNCGGMGNTAVQSVNSSNQSLSLDLSADSHVGSLMGDWDAAAVGTAWVPNVDFIPIERAVVGTGYSIQAARWTAQTAGTQSFGGSGGSGTRYRGFVYEILISSGTTTPVTSDVELQWHTHNRVTSDVDLRWRTSARITNDLDLRWRTYSQLASDLDLRWLIYNRTISDVEIHWRTSSQLASDLELRWLTYSQLASDIDLRWRTYSQLASDVELRWIVLSSMLRVESDLDLYWCSYSRLTSDLNLHWLAYSRLISDVEFSWLTYISVMSDLELRWRVLSLSGQQFFLFFW